MKSTATAPLSTGCKSENFMFQNIKQEQSDESVKRVTGPKYHQTEDIRQLKEAFSSERKYTENKTGQDIARAGEERKQACFTGSDSAQLKASSLSFRCKRQDSYYQSQQGAIGEITSAPLASLTSCNQSRSGINLEMAAYSYHHRNNVYGSGHKFGFYQSKLFGHALLLFGCRNIENDLQITVLIWS